MNGSGHFNCDISPTTSIVKIMNLYPDKNLFPDSKADLGTKHRTMNSKACLFLSPISDF